MLPASLSVVKPSAQHLQITETCRGLVLKDRQSADLSACGRSGKMLQCARFQATGTRQIATHASHEIYVHTYIHTCVRRGTHVAPDMCGESMRVPRRWARTRAHTTLPPASPAVCLDRRHAQAHAAGPCSRATNSKHQSRSGPACAQHLAAPTCGGCGLVHKQVRTRAPSLRFARTRRARLNRAAETSPARAPRRRCRCRA